ncbi:MAG: hypothetical protein NW220_05590 [Leptolyngbyaceae cyanobacterium bins.349]|nr:hypothetical protein [Leptolyngbyaceae cyanobacterium bins.349]
MSGRNKDGREDRRDRSPTVPLIAKPDLYQVLEAALPDAVTAEITFRQWVREQSNLSQEASAIPVRNTKLIDCPSRR